MRSCPSRFGGDEKIIQPKRGWDEMPMNMAPHKREKDNGFTLHYPFYGSRKQESYSGGFNGLNLASRKPTRRIEPDSEIRNSPYSASS